jgi:hypothetical protein
MKRKCTRDEVGRFGFLAKCYSHVESVNLSFSDSVDNRLRISKYLKLTTKINRYSCFPMNWPWTWEERKENDARHRRSRAGQSHSLIDFSVLSSSNQRWKGCCFSVDEIYLGVRDASVSAFTAASRLKIHKKPWFGKNVDLGCINRRSRDIDSKRRRKKSSRDEVFRHEMIRQEVWPWKTWQYKKPINFIFARDCDKY